MTQFYARENESLRARIASLESAAAATGSTSSELDETRYRKRLQDAERRANDAEAQMTGMERAHVNALTRLETAGREAADAAAEEHEKLATDLERIRSELLETTRAKERAERDAADARRDAASSAAAARSALEASAATSPPESPAREGEGGREVFERDPVKPLSSPSPSPSPAASSHRVSSRRPRSVHQSLPSSESFQAARLAGERVRKRREAEARRAAEEASARAREEIDKKDAELAELRELVAKLRGDASEAQRERSKAEAKAWEWRRALRASEKAAKDAAGLLRRRDEEQTEGERRRLLSAEKTPANPGRTSWVPPGRASVTSPKRTPPPRASPRSSTRSNLSTPPETVVRNGQSLDAGPGLLDPKPHPSTVESARLEAEELATRRRVREETVHFDVFAPFGSPPGQSDRNAPRATPSRRRLDLQSPHRRSADAASLRTECASLRIENERLASDVARWRAEASAVADQARESERTSRERELRRLEKALADADTRARVLATEAKTLRDSRDDALATARVQAGTEARILRDELEAVSADLEGARRDLSAARAKEEALVSRLAEKEKATASAESSRSALNDLDKERIARANARIAELTASLGEVEDERFELRRALEAHVTALVEAKVDSAELAGTVAELRKELARMNVRYQRAAARCAKMEASSRGDAVGRPGLGRAGGDDAANSPA